MLLEVVSADPKLAGRSRWISQQEPAPGFMGDEKLVPGSQVGGKAWHQGHQNPRVPVVGRDAFTQLDSTAPAWLWVQERVVLPPKHTLYLFIHSTEISRASTIYPNML